jgi:hypothetical protein
MGSLFVIAGLALAGCTPVSSSTVVPRPTPSVEIDSAESCLGDVVYPGLAITNLHQILPIDDVNESYVQSEINIIRGSGSCVDQDLGSMVSNPCAPIAGEQSTVVGEMLGTSPDDIATVEFARGAQQVLTETGTGHTDSGETFQYRLSAWHFDSAADAKKSVVFSLVKSCAGAQIDGARIHVDVDGAPRVVVIRSGPDVFLIENMQNVSIDGVEGIVLSLDAMTTVESWWESNAARYFATGHVAQPGAS